MLHLVRALLTETFNLQYGILCGIFYLTSPYFDNNFFIPGTDFTSARYEVADVDCPAVWHYSHKS